VIVNASFRRADLDAGDAHRAPLDALQAEHDVGRGHARRRQRRR
jgi:hypothetical protein